LRDEDLSVRVQARLVLTRSGEAGMPYLIAALRDEAREVRYEAVIALVNMRDPARMQALPELVRCLRDEYWLVRLNALAALGSIGPPARRATAAIQRLLTDEKPSLRGVAAETLTRIRGPDAVPLLLDALRDERSRRHALDALGKLGPEAVPALRKWSRVDNLLVQQAVAEALARLEADPVD
jgi:HEAT repeat protein